MTRIDTAELLPSERVLEIAAYETLTQLHREQQYAPLGDNFEVDGRRVDVTEVVHRSLGDPTDADARRERSPDLDAYRERLRRVHDTFE